MVVSCLQAGQKQSSHGLGEVRAGVASGVGMNISNQPRTVYKLVTSATGKKSAEPVTIHLGISDGTVCP